MSKRVCIYVRVSAIKQTVENQIQVLRDYSDRWSHEDAATQLVSKRGLDFDPLVVDAFIGEKENFKTIALQYKDG
jgi:response regulator RpfG family c-di-GMP phosphodiesterase